MVFRKAFNMIFGSKPPSPPEPPGEKHRNLRAASRRKNKQPADSQILKEDNSDEFQSCNARNELKSSTMGAEHTAKRPRITSESERCSMDKGLVEDERERQIRFLTSELEKSKKLSEDLDKEYAECRKTRDEFEQGYNAAKNAITKQGNDMTTLSDANSKLKRELAEVEPYVAKQKLRIKQLMEVETRQKRDIAKLKDTTAQQSLSITELTETILLSTRSTAATTRDDDWFEVEFASLASAIHQWVFRYFRGAPGVKHQDLLPTVRESLKLAIFGYETIPDTKVSLKEIEAAVTERLTSHIFHNDFLFMIHKLAYPPSWKILGGTDRDKMEWHAQTVNLILQNDQYEERLRAGIDYVVKDIKSCFFGLAKAGSEEQCLKALHAIVEKAARLEVETYRQISKFELQSIKPGSGFNSLLMDDRSGTADGAEAEDRESQNLLVQLVLFPAVLRWQFDDSGKTIKDPVIVRKGIVIAAPLNPEVKN